MMTIEELKGKKIGVLMGGLLVLDVHTFPRRE
jgi:hypothetical protein